MNALLDNDILQKGLRYNLVSHLLAANKLLTSDIGVLGSAEFVLRDLTRKLQPESESQVVQRRLEDFLCLAQILEPTKEEMELSAEFELLAQIHHQPFDTGESQLCAVLVSRALPLLITGDKRAITALEILIDHDTRLTPVGVLFSLWSSLRTKRLILWSFVSCKTRFVHGKR